MSFEYGCAITNKYAFLDEGEDPSDLLAQVSVVDKAGSKDAKSGKDAKSTKGGKDAKAGSKDAKTGGKDAKKQPLQQQTDNSVKSGSKDGGDAKKASGQQQQGQNKPRQPELNKENAVNRQAGGGSGRPFGDRRQPRQEGEGGGFRNNNQDGTKPARRSGPPRDGQEGGGGGGFGSFGGPRPDRPPRRPRTDNEGNVIEGGSGEQGGEDGGFRRTGGGGGGFRGPRGGAGGSGGFRRFGGAGGEGGNNFKRRSNDPDHPREFDRHSGNDKTGIKPIDKKDGAGKGNWGTPEDEIVAEETLNDTQGEQNEGNSNWAARVDESEEAKKEDENEENKDTPNLMTLDEYKALQMKINNKNEFNIRKPGEGEDLSKWGKTYVLPKKADEEDEEEEDEEEEDEEENEDEEDEKKKSLINQIQIKFYEPAQSGRGGRDDRGGDRRGGARGGDRGDRPPRRDGGDRPPRREGGDRDNRRPPKTERTHNDSAPAPLGDDTAVQASVVASSGVSPLKQEHTGEQHEQRRDGGFKPRQQGSGGGGGGRGGNNGPRRDGGGGGGGRGGQSGRGNQPRVHVPKIEDEKDFPSLGKA